MEIFAEDVGMTIYMAGHFICSNYYRITKALTDEKRTLPVVEN
jgi:hypothetical protein